MLFFFTSFRNNFYIFFSNAAVVFGAVFWEWLLEQQLLSSVWLWAQPAALGMGGLDTGLSFSATSVSKYSLCPVKCGFVTGDPVPK